MSRVFQATRYCTGCDKSTHSRSQTTDDFHQLIAKSTDFAASI
jgi:hypothetical protein